jgi:hypothetical protein
MLLSENLPRSSGEIASITSAEFFFNNRAASSEAR